MLEKLDKLLLPEKYWKAPDVAFRRNFAVGILIGCIQFLLFSWNYWALGIAVLPQRVMEGFLILLLSAVAMKLKGDITISGNILLVGVFHTLVVASAWAGGVEAPGIIWVPLAILAANFYLGKKTTFFWSFTFVAGIAVLFAVGKFGNLPANVFTPEQMSEFKIKAVLASNATIVWFTWTYRSEKEKSHRISQQQLAENINLVRVLTHDVATPIQIMNFWTSQLPESSKAKPRMERALKAIADTLAHVRDYRAVIDGKKELELKKVSVNLLVHQVVDLFKERLHDKSIIVSIDEPQELWILADPKVITSQVFANIVSNAIKFSKPESRIEIGIHQKGNSVQISIRDHGIGIPKSLRENIFSLSKKTSRTGTQGEMGTGFGMPLVLSYVQLHHGAINIESWDIAETPSYHGTNVVFTFPMALSESIAA